MRILYHEAAEAELLGEVGYLETCAAGLGRRFLDEVRRVEDLIAGFPESAERVGLGIRMRRLRKFPCSLLYSIEVDHLLILAVANHHRRPGYWVDRAGGGRGVEEGAPGTG